MTATGTCQICLDTIVAGKENSIVTRVCGKDCSAEICRQCLGRHVEVTLQQFYPGVLPRVRCPICLVMMHSSRWEKHVPIEVKPTVMMIYFELCRQACVVTPPCCDKPDYTHLPDFSPQNVPHNPIKVLPSQLETFKLVCKQFCRHKTEPRAVLDFAFDTFGDEKAMILINDLTLPRIQDTERRATLLLSLMFFRPNTKTNCCGLTFCYNCKCVGHHDSCVEDFDVDNDLVRCRVCRVLLLKVEGCDAVNCVCGSSLSWALEQRLYRSWKKGIIPVDIFNIPLTNNWLRFQDQMPTLLKSMRQKWLDKHLVGLRPLLKPIVAAYVWRFRCRKILLPELRGAWESRRKRQLDHHLAAVRDTLKKAVATFVWYRRFAKAVVAMKAELFWKAYHRGHPEALQDEAEETHTLCSITSFDTDEEAGYK